MKDRYGPVVGIDWWGGGGGSSIGPPCLLIHKGQSRVSQLVQSSMYRLVYLYKYEHKLVSFCTYVIEKVYNVNNPTNEC